MKKVIILYDYFNPAYKAGGPIRSLDNLVKMMSRDLDLYILTTNRDHDGTVLNVVPDQWILYGGSAHIRYLSKQNLGFKSIKNCIKKVKPDVLYINGIFSLLFVIYPLMILSRDESIKIIISARGMLQEGALRLKFFKKSIYLKFLKPFVSKKPNLIWHATDDQERMDIKKFAPKCKIRVVGNMPGFQQQHSYQSIQKSIDFVSISLIAPKKNHIQFIETLKKVRAKKDISFHIYGPVSDKKYFKQIQREIADLPEHLDIKYLGELQPNEINEILIKCRFFVLTSLGENFGHSIFEAFNQGIPVIISDKTPWKGLTAKKAGWDVSLSEPSNLQRAIEEAISMDEDTYREYQTGARSVATEYMKENDLKAAYLELFTS